MINEVIIPILMLLARIVSTIVIVQFILGLLIAFNVVGQHNNFVSALWQGTNAILDPILRPIRRHMPRTAAIDFSPLVLLVLIQIAIIILEYIGRRVG